MPGSVSTLVWLSLCVAATLGMNGEWSDPCESYLAPMIIRNRFSQWWNYVTYIRNDDGLSYQNSRLTELLDLSWEGGIEFWSKTVDDDIDFVAGPTVFSGKSEFVDENSGYPAHVNDPTNLNRQGAVWMPMSSAVNVDENDDTLATLDWYMMLRLPQSVETETIEVSSDDASGDDSSDQNPLTDDRDNSDNSDNTVTQTTTTNGVFVVYNKTLWKKYQFEDGTCSWKVYQYRSTGISLGDFVPVVTQA